MARRRKIQQTFEELAIELAVDCGFILAFNIVEPKAL